MYENFFNNHPLPMFVADAASFDFLDVNESALRKYGFSRQEVEGMNLRQLRTADDTDAICQTLKNLSVWQGEDVHRKKDGTELDVDVVAHKILHHGREVWMSTVNDVSERKKAERELAGIELRYRMFVEQSTEGIWRYELRKPMPVTYSLDELVAHFYAHCYLAECNDAMAQMYGLQRKEELIGKNAAFFLPQTDPASRAFFETFHRNRFTAKNTLSYESDVRGNVKIFLNNYSGYVEQGCLLRVWGSQSDITQQKADEESIEYLASIVEHSADAIYSVAQDRGVITWNKACEKLTGVKAHEIKGLGVRDFFFYRSISARLKTIRDAVLREGSWKGEAEMQHKGTGAVLHVLVYIIAQKDEAGAVNRLLVFCRDISEAKKAEHLLRESEERFINMADAAPAMIYMIDEKDRPFYFNHEWLRFTGRSLQEEICVNSMPDIYPDDLERVKHTYYTNTLARRPFELEYRRRNVHNEFRWIVDRSTPRFLNDGTYVGYVSFCFDIHERKKTEEENKRQAVQLAGILNGIADGFLAMDNRFLVTMWNKEAERIFGIQAEDIVGRPAHLHFKAYKNKPVAKLLNEALLNKKPFQCEEFIDRNQLWVEATLYPYPDGCLIYFKDTTSRRRKQMLLELQKQMLEANSNGKLTAQQGAVMLTNGVEKIFPGTLCTVCYANTHTGLLQTVLTPSIPAPLTGQVGKLKIADLYPDDAPPQPLVVPNVQTDWRWQVYREQTKAYGIQTAVVVPVLSSQGKVMAALSIYFFKACAVETETLEILQQLAAVAAAILEKRRAEKRQRELEQRLADEKLAHQKRISKALLEGSERERAEISMELHDNVSQVLSSAKLYMELGIAEDKILSPLARKGVDYLMDGINEIRRLSHQLASPAVRDLGFAEAVQGHLHSLQRVKALQVSFACSVNNVETEMGEDVQLSLYRMVQEQTSNILKYAAAKAIAVELRRSADAFVLVVEDDGVGFDMQRVKKGLGLANIVSRAAIFKGTAVFATAPGKGCRLEVTIPVRNEMVQQGHTPNQKRA